MPGTHKDPATAHCIGSPTNIITYIEVLIRYKKMIVRTTLAAFFSAIVISLLMTKIYSSTALIIPPQQDAGMLGLMIGSAGTGMANLAGDLLGKGTSSDLYASILKSEAMKDRIIDSFNLMKAYGHKYRMDTYQKLSKTVSIEVDKKSGIISISVLDKDPKRAADIANAYANELGKLSINLNATDALQNKLFLEERLAKTRVDLARAEDALKAFQLKYKTLDVSEQAKGTIRSIAELESQLSMEEVKLASAKRIFTDDSQEVKNQQSIVSNIKSEIAKFEGSRTTSTLPGVGIMPRIGQEHMRLMRDFKMQEMLMEMLTKQYELTKFSGANTNPNIKIIQNAKIADKKTKPKRAILVLAATFTTFILTTFYAFILDLINRMTSEQRTVWKKLFRRLLTNSPIDL